MKWCLVASLLGCSQVTSCQSVGTLMGARAAGMGYASSVLSDESAFFNNIGSLARLNASSTFFSYEAQPSLQGANRTAACLSLHSRLGVGGFGFFRFGDDLYREQIASAAFGNKFGIASLGLKVNHIQYQASGFETRRAVTLDFGGLAQLTPQLSAGAYILNLNQARIAADEHLPTRMVAGIGFKAADGFFISAEIDKLIDFDATWRTGLEYSILNKMFVRTGFNLNPRAVSFGVGGQSQQLKADYALQFSNNLGTSHQASAVYLFERRTNREK